MSSGLAEMRRLVEHQGRHQVVSLYLDLDPERFATPPTRASQIRSLIDEAARVLEAREELEHEDKLALREDLTRIDDFLTSADAPFQGARALAIFCASRDDLFEVVQLPKPLEARIVIDARPYIEPMVAAAAQRHWLVALVNRRSGRILAGSPATLRERQRVESDSHGQHDQGGWSQARYERSVEKDADDHLREAAEALERRWRRERFDRVAIGGPQEVVARFEELLGKELRAQLAPGRVQVDLSSAGDAEVREAVEALVEEDDRRSELEALERLADGVGAGRGAVAGVKDTIDALNERRVQTLLLSAGFDQPAGRCPTCGLLVVGGAGGCPADGSSLEELEHLREAAVEAAIVQDADVRVIVHHLDRAPRGGIGALLRF